MADYTGRCVGGPMNGEELTHHEPHFMIQPMKAEHDAGVYQHCAPIWWWRADVERPSADEERKLKEFALELLAKKTAELRDVERAAIERAAKVAEAYPTDPPFGDLYTADNLIRHGQDCAAKDIAKFIRALAEKE